MQIAPYYRNYELPWNEHQARDERYRKIQRGLLLAFLVFGSLIPLLPRSIRRCERPKTCRSASCS